MEQQQNRRWVQKKEKKKQNERATAVRKNNTIINCNSNECGSLCDDEKRKQNILQNFNIFEFDANVNALPKERKYSQNKSTNAQSLPNIKTGASK